MGVGVVFATIGVAFSLTMDNLAIGLPFVVLGIFFLGRALAKPGQKAGAEGEDRL